MTSLTRISITVRKIIRFSVFFVIFLIVAKILFDLGSGIYRRIFPAPPPPPTVTYGKLPKLPFPDKKGPALTYKLETAEGGLPLLGPQSKVYFMPKLSPNLLSLDVAKVTATELGFNPQETEVTPTVYKFAHKANPQTLEINIITGAFSISTDLKTDPSMVSKKPPAPEVASTHVKQFLTAGEILPDDLTGPTTYEFLKIEGESLVTATSLSEADLVKVNQFRKNYDELPSLTTDPNTANVWFMVGGELERSRQILAGQFHYFPVDESNSSTYPIKDSQAAWDELNAGAAFMATPGLNKEGETVTIRKIYLAYFDSGVPMEFYQPIIVFEGDRGFMAYTSAVSADYYGE